ncbi:branched-chain amino acid ABC transporter permease [Emticicia sp. W12TSBA100-4]|uniref:branched-chain amino acid ABC transporter permease n=1 Tax=Emticicia sp. W12TSBA100-4 TaxID=3160965 RepID=UPI0033065621
MNWFNFIFICELYIMLTLSANIVSGYTGLLSFSYAAFYGLGAYATAILMKSAGVSFFPAMLIAMIFNLMLSTVLSYFAIRMKDVFFTIGTIGVQIIVFRFFYNADDLTGGSLGLSEIPTVSIFGYALNGSRDYAILGGVLLALVIGFFAFLQTTPFIRTLSCIRDRELGAITIGKPINYYKFVCNAIAAVVCTIAGALYATNSSYIDPTSFTLDESILVVSMLLIGGTGNLIGPIFGAFFYTALPELIRLIPISSSQGASLRLMLYGLILILVVRYRPNGVFGKFRFE